MCELSLFPRLLFGADLGSLRRFCVFEFNNIQGKTRIRSVLTFIELLEVQEVELVTARTLMATT